MRMDWCQLLEAPREVIRASRENCILSGDEQPDAARIRKTPDPKNARQANTTPCCARGSTSILFRVRAVEGRWHVDFRRTVLLHRLVRVAFLHAHRPGDVSQRNAGE
jgi:hypothetical protein